VFEEMTKEKVLGFKGMGMGIMGSYEGMNE
jgi:hypothetical protein